LEFGAQTAALYGLGMSTNADGSYTTAAAQANIQAAVINAQNSNWNIAQTGPQGVGGVWSKPVTFSAIQFVPNPLDATEFFTQVTSQRVGTDALQQFFIPLAYVGLPNSGPAPPPQVQNVSLTNTVEVLGQPATRIGYAAPLGSAVGTRANQLLQFACLPLAISNTQFVNAALPTTTTKTYTIDLVTSATPQATPPSGHINGCLVNVAGTGNGTNYYGPGQGNLAINQIESLLGYFGATGSTQPPIAPAGVEAGSLLSALDPANAANTARWNELLAVVATLKIGHTYIVPVLAQNPSFATNNQVVGFAYLTLDSVNTTGALSSVTFDIAPSVPLRNASSAAGFSGIPGNTTALMPIPVAPFAPRAVDPMTNGMTTRPRGVVLAPAVSPRQLKPPVVPTR